MEPEDRFKVLFMLNSFGTGGSERVVLDICRGMNRDVFEPFVVSLYCGELSGEFDKIQVWNTCLDKKDGVDFPLMLRLANILRNKKIDVINAHHFSPFIHSYLGSMMNRCSLIYTDHTVHEIRKIPSYWAMIGTLLLKTCYAVIGISNGCTRQLMETFHVPDHKAITILNAIDMDRFEHPIDRESKRQELHLNPEDKVVGIVGNLREQKNHVNLLRAFRIITKNSTTTKLMVIGDGPMRDQLHGLAKELGIEANVLFLGARLDTVELYQAMDIYCLSSHYEGLPLTILEAMASKVPIVATDVIGINDVVIKGETGLLVEPDNPEKLAQAALSLLDQPQKGFRLAENGYHYVYAHHRMEPWVKMHERVFRMAAQGVYAKF